MASSSFIIALTIILAIIQGIHAVRFTLVNEVEKTEAGAYFNSLMTKKYGEKLMKTAANYIKTNFEQWTVHDEKSMKKITLYIDGNDKASSYHMNGDDNEIHISAKYLKSLEVDESQSRRVFKELLYYEMTHVLQWTGNGEISKGLKDGIATFMVLKADYEPKDWAIKGQGTKWDERYDVTARFLEYCRDLSTSIDFIAKLNRSLKDSYSEEIFSKLLGKSIDVLWSDYKKKYKKDGETNT